MSKYEPRDGDIAVYAVKEKKNDRGPDYTGRALIDGKERDVSFAELTLSNNLSQQAIARLLISKGVFSAEELLQAMQEVRQENYASKEKHENPSENTSDDSQA